jgi:hypothetical protein
MGLMTSFNATALKLIITTGCGGVGQALAALADGCGKNATYLLSNVSGALNGAAFATDSSQYFANWSSGTPNWIPKPAPTVSLLTTTITNLAAGSLTSVISTGAAAECTISNAATGGFGENGKAMITRSSGISFSATAIGDSGTVYTTPSPWTTGLTVWIQGLVNLGQITSFDAATLKTKIMGNSSGIGYITGSGVAQGVGTAATFIITRTLGSGALIGFCCDATGAIFSAYWTSGEPEWTSTAPSEPQVKNLGTFTTFDAATLISQIGVGGTAMGVANAAVPGSCGYTGTYFLNASGNGTSIVGTAIGHNGKSSYCMWGPGIPSSWIGGSNTITHQTNIQNFDASKIGCYCESTGELADVYGEDFVPSLDRATDAIVKVKQSTTLNPAVLGIIVGPDTFASHGDVLCVE